MPAQNLPKKTRNHSAWGMFMGFVTAALGLFPIVYSWAAATITTVLLGWTLIFVGIAQFVSALQSQTPEKFLLKILRSVLYGMCCSATLTMTWAGGPAPQNGEATGH